MKDVSARRRAYGLAMKSLMLLAAGLSMRKVFERITRDYRKEQEQQGRGKKRYAYEEIARTYYEMESGVIELEAYERMGMRCEVPAYRRLSLLLAQNLKKGSQGLIPLLEQEARDAFEQRKRFARTEGEKAAVRLLLPMGMMLLVVFVLMMFPAFLSF